MVTKKASVSEFSTTLTFCHLLAGPVSIWHDNIISLWPKETIDINHTSFQTSVRTEKGISFILARMCRETTHRSDSKKGRSSKRSAEYYQMAETDWPQVVSMQTPPRLSTLYTRGSLTFKAREEEQLDLTCWWSSFHKLVERLLACRKSPINMVRRSTVPATDTARALTRPLCVLVTTQPFTRGLNAASICLSCARMSTASLKWNSSDKVAPLSSLYECRYGKWDDSANDNCRKDVHRMLRARPPAHTATEISETMTFRSHIAILKKKKNDKDRQASYSKEGHTRGEQ